MALSAPDAAAFWLLYVDDAGVSGKSFWPRRVTLNPLLYARSGDRIEYPPRQFIIWEIRRLGIFLVNYSCRLHLAVTTNLGQCPVVSKDDPELFMRSLHWQYKDAYLSASEVIES